jgi:hypothetical protein
MQSLTHAAGHRGGRVPAARGGPAPAPQPCLRPGPRTRDAPPAGTGERGRGVEPAFCKGRMHCDAAP